MKNKEIAQLAFLKSKPTVLNLKLLQNWVVWQFPKQTAVGYCGAVHPPQEKFGWLPAIIHPKNQEALVYGHLAKTFDTPELAAEHCLKDEPT